MLKRIDIKKPFSLNVGGLLGSILFVYLIYVLLLQDNIGFFSIGSVQLSLNHWLKHWHILSVSLLPVYVALIFFGAGLFGYVIGSYFQRWLKDFL